MTGGRTCSPARRRSATREVATELSAATGRAVAFVDVPDDAAWHQLTQGGVPDAIAGEIVGLFRCSAAARPSA